MRKICSSERESIRSLGDTRAKKLKLRLVQLQAAENLAEMRLLPAARLHSLKGEMEGKFAVDLNHPFRLVFESAHNPAPTLPDVSPDYRKITKISILDIVDYHG
ncbi:MAG: type II toxin-antitoxin system RelE/ParE family toxin [Nitrospinae bacterium]|nr:type II toxin-antitoxin system RelE/ParE family toxin [Nitrospinota bacterium]